MTTVKDFIDKYQVLPKRLIMPQERMDFLHHKLIIDDIIEGRHKKVFGWKMREEKQYKKYYKVDNMTADLVKMKRDLIVKDGFEIYAQENKDYFKNFIKSNKLKKLRANNVMNSLLYGNGFLYLDLVRNRKNITKYDIKLRIADPSNVWYIKSLDSNYVYDVGYIFVDNEVEVIEAGNKVKYLILVIHSETDFTTLRYKLVGDNYLFIEEMPNAYYDHSDIEDFFVFNFKNEETLEFNAPSEITHNILNRQHHLNIAKTVKYIVLHRVARPTKFMNGEALDNLAGKTRFGPDGTREVEIETEKFVDGGSLTEFYLKTEEVTGYLKEISDDADKERDEMCHAMNIDAGMYRELQNTPPSGKSLLIQNHKTINNVKYKQGIEKDEWERLFDIVQRIDQKENKDIKNLDDIEMEFNVSLFKDKEQELIEEGLMLDNYQKKKDLGVFISNEYITKSAEGLSDEEIIKEKEIMNQEQNNDVPYISDNGTVQNMDNTDSLDV